MAQSNYEGEIKQSMAEKPKGKPLKGKPSSRSNGPPSSAPVASRPPGGASSARSNQPPVVESSDVGEIEPMQAAPRSMSGGGAHSPAHAAMAASIAHAILQKGGQ